MIEAVDERQAEAISRNLAAAFELVARHAGVAPAPPRRFGEVLAIPTGIPSAFYNPVLALRPGVTAENVVAACAWVDGLGVTPSVHARDDLLHRPLREAIDARGMAADDWAEPAMALEPLPTETMPAPGLRIEIVGLEAIGAWQRAVAGSDEALPRIERIFTASLATDRDSQVFGGFVDDRLVATSWAVRSGDILGIYAVGTDEEARHRGFGTAMTGRCLDAGRAWGCTSAILQSSRMAVGMYERIGFRTVARYRVFMPGA